MSTAAAAHKQYLSLVRFLECVSLSWSLCERQMSDSSSNLSLKSTGSVFTSLMCHIFCLVYGNQIIGFKERVEIVCPWALIPRLSVIHDDGAN